MRRNRRWRATSLRATVFMSGIPSPSTAPKPSPASSQARAPPRSTMREGREILDLISSWWTCTHGHAHPALNEALAAQAARFEHVMFAGFTHQPAVDLASALSQLLPGDLSARLLLRRRLDLGRGRAQDRLSILGQSRRGTKTRLHLLRRRLSRRYARRHVARAWLRLLQSVPQSDVPGGGAALPLHVRGRRCGRGSRAAAR